MIAGEFVTDGRRRVAIGASIGCIALMYGVISQSTALLYTALALGGFGFFFFVLSTVIQGLLIGSSPDEFRGRVMGLYTMVTAGGVPIAALIGGAIGSLFGPGEAVGLAAIVMLALLVWILAARRLRVVRFDVAAQNPDDPLPAVVEEPYREVPGRYRSPSIRIVSANCSTVWRMISATGSNESIRPAT